MTQYTYKDLYVKERKYAKNGIYQVYGDHYIKDECIAKDRYIADFIILRSADEFIRRQEEENERIAKKEEARLRRSGTVDVPGTTSGTGP